jgi:hypothetical protein
MLSQIFGEEYILETPSPTEASEAARLSGGGIRRQDDTNECKQFQGQGQGTNPGKHFHCVKARSVALGDFCTDGFSAASCAWPCTINSSKWSGALNYDERGSRKRAVEVRASGIYRRGQPGTRVRTQPELLGMRKQTAFARFISPCSPMYALRRASSCVMQFASAAE